MTERERNLAMDELARVDAQIAEGRATLQAIEARNLVSKGQAASKFTEDLRWSIKQLTFDRQRVLDRFPEVQYWPGELAAGGAT